MAVHAPMEACFEVYGHDARALEVEAERVLARLDPEATWETEITARPGVMAEGVIIKWCGQVEAIARNR